MLGSSGAISSRGPGTNGAQLQREALEAEGVEVVPSRSGDLRVNLTTYGWFPEPGTIGIGVEVNAQPEANAEEEAAEEDEQDE